MPCDPLSARNLAGACALGGLVVMMLEPAPSWSAVATGLLALAAFAVLTLAGSRRPAGLAPHRRRISVEVVIEDRPVPDPRLAPQRGPGPPGPADAIAAHPAMLAGVRARRAAR
ncbi:hypothetical protein [Methylobacterium segetis]|uniref:hypothetical protein n=1 Tax=Methylobacterium segetis TaxID=2488750 RepID=UPI0010516AA3|nr:hypothetical protein [Methylobacterium segetis]